MTYNILISYSKDTYVLNETCKYRHLDTSIEHGTPSRELSEMLVPLHTIKMESTGTRSTAEFKWLTK